MKNGSPTAESLAKLYKALESQNFGKGAEVVATYYSDADAKKINKFAQKRMNDPKRDPYSVLMNNCKDFANDAIDAGRK